MNRRSVLLAALHSSTAPIALLAPNPAPGASPGSNPFAKLPGRATLAAGSSESEDIPPLPEITKGREPLVRENADIWPQVKEVFYKLYGPIGYAQASPYAAFSLLGHPVNDPKQLGTADLLSPGDNLNYHGYYLYNHADVLLQQIAEFAQRILDEEVRFIDLCAKAASMALDIDKYISNDLVHEREISAGIYTTPFEISNKELEAANAKLSATRDNAFRMHPTLFGKEVPDCWSDAALTKSIQASAILSALPYEQTHYSPQLGGLVNVNLFGRSGTADALAVAAVQDSVGRTVEAEKLSFLYQQTLATGALDEAGARFDAAKAKRAWDLANIEFQRSRVQQVRENADVKVRLAITPGGSFNYAEKVFASRNLILSDLHEVINRMSVCSRGLQAVYGYDSKLPTSVMSRSTDVYLSTIITDCIKWVRDSQQFMTAYTMIEQGYTLSISVLRLIGPAAWRDGLSAGKWVFNFDEALVPGQANVRLTGANLYVRPSEGIWSGSLAPPPNSFFVRPSGEHATVDQSNGPLVRFGRIHSRKAERYQEIYGTMSLRNIAPLGSWTLTISETSTEGERRDVLQDVEIDFDINVQSRG